MNVTLTAARERPMLSRELSSFLAELAVALNNHSIYPPEHPGLRRTSEAIRARLDSLLHERPIVTLGVAQSQIVIEGQATDPRNSVLRGLAQRLHRRRIGGMTLERGISENELTDLLRTIADEERPLFIDELALIWDHAVLHPINYRRLTLAEEEERDRKPFAETGSSASRLWLRLASAALDGPLDESVAATDPATLARAIGAKSTKHDQVIAECLLQLAAELKHNGHEEEEVTERISSLVTSLGPDALERLVASVGTAAKRRQLVLDASHAFTADAVIEIVCAASAGEQSISHSLLRLFSKLASHCRSVSKRQSDNASAALRAQVSALVRGWSLTDPNPCEYTAVLDAMTRERKPAGARTDDPSAPEPLRVTQMCLELDLAGPRLAEALDRLESQETLGDLFPLLTALPEPNRASEVVCDRLSRTDVLHSLIARGAAGLKTLDHLLVRMGTQAVEPLLDILATSEERTVRRNVVERLVSYGAGIVPPVAARLKDNAPWYFHRNLLCLLHDVGAIPPELPYARFLNHADARVRREAVRLLLRSEEWRTRALCSALADGDPQVQQLALADAQRGCPPKAVAPLLAWVGNRTATSQQRVLAIRGLQSVRTAEVLETLLPLVRKRRGWFGRLRLAPTTPEMLAALGVLASQWKGEPRVDALLRQAQRNDDPKLRALLTASAGST
jgi:hypothetical protein